MVKIRLTKEMIENSKFYTELILNDENYRFNEKTGEWVHFKNDVGEYKL